MLTFSLAVFRFAWQTSPRCRKADFSVKSRPAAPSGCSPVARWKPAPPVPGGSDRCPAERCQVRLTGEARSAAGYSDPTSVWEDWPTSLLCLTLTLVNVYLKTNALILTGFNVNPLQWNYLQKSSLMRKQSGLPSISGYIKLAKKHLQILYNFLKMFSVHGSKKNP